MNTALGVMCIDAHVVDMNLRQKNKSMNELELRIDSVQGNYLVAVNRDIESRFIKLNLKIGELDISCGDYTDLYGWFTEPVEYMGMLDGFAVFYLGKGDSTLFEDGREYYDLTMIITPTRIGKSYRAGTFRDVHLKKNEKGEYRFL